MNLGEALPKHIEDRLPTQNMMPQLLPHVVQLIHVNSLFYFIHFINYLIHFLSQLPFLLIYLIGYDDGLLVARKKSSNMHIL